MATRNLLHAPCPFRVLHPDVTVVQPGQDWDGDNGTAPLHPGACAGGTGVPSRGLTCAGDVGGGVMLQWNIRIATFFIVSAAIATTAVAQPQKHQGGGAPAARPAPAPHAAPAPAAPAPHAAAPAPHAAAPAPHAAAPAPRAPAPHIAAPRAAPQIAAPRHAPPQASAQR